MYTETIQQAVANKQSGRLNCAQSVACAFAEKLGADPQTTAAMTAAFGTGMGTMQATCGALIGAGCALGIRVPDRTAARATMARIFNKFSIQGGDTVCSRLKGIKTGRPLCSCDDCVRIAATLLADELSALTTAE